MKTLEQNDIKTIIIDILTNISPANNKDINIKTSIYEDLLFDSILFIEYILKIEEKFNISIDEDLLDLSHFETVESAIKYISQKISS